MTPTPDPGLVGVAEAIGPSLPPRRLGVINARGLWELYLKEVRRFLKVYLQTLVAPLVTTLIFLAIFALSMGTDLPRHSVGFMEFLAPGLIMMAMVQNAFANTSSSLIIAKVQGSIVDVLMPPLSATELTLGYTLGGVTRGLLVGVAVAVGMAFFVTLHVHSWFYILYHAVGASLMLSLLGVLAGVWADKFDHMASVTNFIITPLSFLSGTFYTIDALPEGARLAAHLNPFFYMIDGFRYGFIGHEQATPLLGLLVVGATDALLGLGCWLMIRRGYKLKA
ncbi:ABC transporter permease [Pararhodospirillum photometricum]|uniref:ABC transporter permease n=1 Tax=Pararhodospirillum photometricum TaxID=1084 RepID=UPI0002D8A43B